MQRRDSVPHGAGSLSTLVVTNETAVRRVAYAARGCAALGLALGCLGLVGWCTGQLTLVAGFGGPITMKANTAVSLSLTGAALWLRTAHASRPFLRGVADMLASIVVAVAVLTLSEHMMGWNLGIDELLFRDISDQTATTYPGRMGPPATVSFTLLGLGLLQLDRSTHWRAAPQWLALFVVWIAALSIFGYIAKASQLYGIAHYTGIALPTAVGILSLSISLCLARPEHGPSYILIADNAGGELSRRVLPAVILLPALIGWLRALGEELGYYDRAFGRALLLVSLTTIFTTIVWTVALRFSGIATARAVAEQKSEEARRESQRLLSENLRTLSVLDSLLAHAPLGLAFFDLSGRCIRANAYLADLHARPMANLQGMSVRSVLPGWDRGLDQALQRVLSDGVSVTDVEILATRDGGERSWLSGFFPVYDPDGQIRSCGCVILESTERRRLESQRAALLDSERTARSEAERSAALKDQFLATLSHELRTPLTAIIGWVAVARNMSAIPEQFGRPLEIIERNARLQAKLVEDLLDVSSISNGKLQLDRQAIDACQLLKNAVQAIAPSAAAKAIRVDTDLPAAPLQLSGDPVRLAQVLDNLLSNAVKFTPQNGEVRVVARPLDTLFEIRVSDSGQGVTSDFLPHVFDRFRQADASTSRRHGGLGLGLSIVRQLVELHGGTVRAESPGAGQGATFTVCLPRSSASLAAPAKEEVLLVGRASLRDLSILVVDDDDDTRELIAHILQQSHARVDTVADAAAALEYLRLQKPDILVSDIGMPGMDGLALIRQVRERHDVAALPAVALTAFVRPDDRELSLKSGFQAHIAKPVDPRELNLAVATLLGRHPSG